MEAAGAAEVAAVAAAEAAVAARTAAGEALAAGAVFLGSTSGGGDAAKPETGGQLEELPRMP